MDFFFPKGTKITFTTDDHGLAFCVGTPVTRAEF
ncbi:hypothetical protein PDIG_27970 [Penicillium digitatum PHI26]|uniref:Uncharacterized protein n=2 Tax=Penicillium digitatum TaxID=36651 RepID=K9GPN3_PEND2|nr:hypothetical protein PDIP_62410 [Penicillium digitatum Pd1]EKV09909.1 hypothetical protein PDIP_62410 [Penicillium digitatum Pd1]EKV15116.1 hypothetical protein PDIG_27970 [Penicillium digitatum PHI26]